ncbi:MAG TPA: glycosyltransferase [Solirubrobacteraceae bacterium]|jgi:glycosyltransferase involved in cell wall biosynthesis|nr:glycosyltransferase [Solirubrobacteraceae bacterium]
MRVAVVAEFYPRAADPVLGVWAHRQAIAARDAGADVRVLVLHRPLPPLAALRDGVRAAAGAATRGLAQPRHARLDGIDVTYVPFLAPPRPLSYGSWGRWAAPSLALALRALRRDFAFDLVHAHNAVPAGEAVRRAGIAQPVVVSVHGGDVFHTVPGSAAGAAAVRAALGRARLVLANSAGIERRCRVLGSPATLVVRLGTDLPAARAEPYDDPTVVTTGHLVARKHHADVLRAVALLADRHPRLRYLVVGDGPEREPLAALAAQLGIAARVELAGQLPHDEALRRTRRASLLAMPSSDEAFGVAYVEAMAGWLPAIAASGEPGPAEIRCAGGGLSLVAAGDVAGLAARIDALLSDPAQLRAEGERARATVQRAFTWAGCGAATVAAYDAALRGSGPRP